VKKLVIRRGGGRNVVKRNKEIQKTKKIEVRQDAICSNQKLEMKNVIQKFT
jgi:hypothetical protein